MNPQIFSGTSADIPNTNSENPIQIPDQLQRVFEEHPELEPYKAKIADLLLVCQDKSLNGILKYWVGLDNESLTNLVTQNLANAVVVENNELSESSVLVIGTESSGQVLIQSETNVDAETGRFPITTYTDYIGLRNAGKTVYFVMQSSSYDDSSRSKAALAIDSEPATHNWKI